MDCHVMQNHDDYIPYYSVDLDYTTEKQHHESTFTMKSATDKNTQISFNCGGKNLIPCTIEISNLSLVKISEGTSSDDNDDPGNNDDPVIEDGENLCADSSNWGGWVYEDEAAAEISTISNGITIDVTNTGSEEWHIQGSYSNLTLTEGATYRVEFDYSATKDVPLGFHVQQNYDPYGQYHYESVNCTTSVQHYSAEFTMTETDDNVVCVFNCGGVSTAVPFSVTVENLSLVRIS
ncbi:MAG: carbohydrate binding domain-containing protein, partial [Porcipelethomonas sp.]